MKSSNVKLPNTSGKKIISAPIPTLKRLPKYLSYLKRLKKINAEYVSATEIAKEMNFSSIQVRKDIQYTGIIGEPKKGFELNELILKINSFLNWDNMEDAFLVGVGGLGKAILGYDGFKNYGLDIIAAFDLSERKNTINEIEVYPVSKLSDLIKRMHINIGVITVPASAAQEIADCMVEAGIIAIWNFAPVELQVPSDIILENVQLSQSLAVLTHKLSQKLIKPKSKKTKNKNSKNKKLKDKQ